jgi:hypothetical protein
MGAGISVDTREPSRSIGQSTRILIRSIWHWIAGFHAPVAASYERAEACEQSATVTQEPAAVANLKTEVRPAPQISSGIESALDEAEIQRRRNLVRIFFNDFWSGSYEKPAVFLQRLDQAEDYVNDRLTASGEVWRLDSQTRVMLGLQPRVNSAGAP